MGDFYIRRCDNCGGTLKWDTRTRSLVCESCKEESKPMSFNDTSDASSFSDYECPGCGAPIMMEPNSINSTCPYCGNKLILKSEISNQRAPDIVVPFFLTAEDAQKEILGHVKNQWFIPKKVKNNCSLDMIKAVYAPFWLYSCKATASGIGKKVEVEFENIPGKGTAQIRNSEADLVFPYDVGRADTFSPDYLLGYQAENPSENKDKSIRRIKRKAIRSIRSKFHEYSAQCPKTTYQDEQISYGLFPIFIYRVRLYKKTYHYVVNGQTGKVVGKLPYDFIIAKTSMIYGVIVAAITIIGTTLGQAAMNPEIIDLLESICAGGMK